MTINLKTFGIVILILLGLNLFQYLSPKVITKEKITIDTLIVTKQDSTILKRKIAEIEYLKSQVKLAGKIKYIQKTDTVTINDTSYIVPNFIASFDTSFSNQIIKLKYHYPENQFDFYHNYLLKEKVIKETKVVTTKDLFEFTHGFLFGAFVNPKGEINLGAGYGFQIRINY